MPRAKTPKPTPEEIAKLEKRREYGQRWRAANRLKLQDYREANKEHRAHIEWCRLLRQYGITVDQHAEMLKRQGGVCGICLKPEKNRRLAVDHDHTTGRVRGLLCWWCNNKLLARRNTAAMFRRAAEYVESDFDGRLIQTRGLNPDAIVVTAVVEVDELSKKLAAVVKRLKTDATVQAHGLVFMNADSVRKV